MRSTWEWCREMAGAALSTMESMISQKKSGIKKGKFTKFKR